MIKDKTRFMNLIKKGDETINKDDKKNNTLKGQQIKSNIQQ